MKKILLCLAMAGLLAACSKQDAETPLQTYPVTLHAKSASTLYATRMFTATGEITDTAVIHAFNHAFPKYFDPTDTMFTGSRYMTFTAADSAFLNGATLSYNVKLLTDYLLFTGPTVVANAADTTAQGVFRVNTAAMLYKYPSVYTTDPVSGKRMVTNSFPATGTIQSLNVTSISFHRRAIVNSVPFDTYVNTFNNVNENAVITLGEKDTIAYEVFNVLYTPK